MLLGCDDECLVFLLWFWDLLSGQGKCYLAVVEFKGMRSFSRHETLRIIKNFTVTIALKVNKTTDGVVRGWYHIFKRLNF